MTDRDINTHGLKMGFGRHKDEFYTRVPVGYLFWMVNSGHSKEGFASAELKRRGSVLPDLEVSGHAMDRASLDCWNIWHENCRKREGLHAWLVRVTGEALKENDCNGGDRYKYLGMKFVIIRDGAWPVLKTVMR